MLRYNSFTLFFKLFFMRSLSILLIFVLCFSSTVFGSTKDTQGGEPSYTKELVSLPSLDVPMQPIGVTIGNVTNTLVPNGVVAGTTTNSYRKMLQSLTGIDANKAIAKKHKLTLGQKLSLLKQVNKFKKESQAPSGGKSQIVALILVIFLGVLGIHRFYLGYTGIGIIQLLTGGCCGVWAFIDLIRIITGDLQPNGGTYSETL